ncbi:MAG: hypothetical protein ACSW8F_01235, partial [bacterium]
KMNIELKRFIIDKKITHIFISCITSTFPRSVVLANEAQSVNCKTVLGGIFPSIVGDIIIRNYSCFNYVVVGGMDKTFLSVLANNSNKTQLIRIPRRDELKMPLSPIMLRDEFTTIFDDSFFVCYELGTGCRFNCSFCTMRKAFGSSYCSRDDGIILTDIANLSRKWKKLKLIDDDIYQAKEKFSFLDFHAFDQVIAETRVEYLSEEFIKRCSSVGITHIITGVESFSASTLVRLNKGGALPHENRINEIIEYCCKYNIILRPVIMFNPPDSIESELEEMVKNTKEWTPQNHVELLMSLYTPHPGLPMPSGKLLTNNLTLFDHLHFIYMPDSLSHLSNETLIRYYNQIVDQTKSFSFNPQLSISNQMIPEYKPFFE